MTGVVNQPPSSTCPCKNGGSKATFGATGLGLPALFGAFGSGMGGGGSPPGTNLPCFTGASTNLPAGPLMMTPDYFLSGPTMNGGQPAIVCQSSQDPTQYKAIGSAYPLFPAAKPCESGYQLSAMQSGPSQYGVFGQDQATRQTLATYNTPQQWQGLVPALMSQQCQSAEACDMNTPCPAGKTCFNGVCVPQSSAMAAGMRFGN